MMKSILLTFLLLMSFGIIKGQSIYNNDGREICVVQGGNFVFVGVKIGFVQNRSVYNASGKKLGSIEKYFGLKVDDYSLVEESLEGGSRSEGVSLYNNVGKEICRILGTEFYSGGGGDRLGFFRGGIIYNGLGKQIGFARNVTTLEVAIYLFFLSN